MENKLIVELKSVEPLDKAHHKIMLTCQKLTGMKPGILANFNVNLIKDGMHRKISGELI
jgi:GxxExxY protein